MSAAIVLRIGRNHRWLQLSTRKPLLSCGSERVLTEPPGFGLYFERGNR